MRQPLKLGLALTFLLSSSGSALGEEPVILTSGDTGKITLPVANNPLSVGPATAVQVTYSAPPSAKFQVLPTSQLQAASIAPGTTFVFVVDYEIGPDPTDGPFDVTLTVNQGNPDAYLDVDPNTSVSFTTSDLRFSVENGLLV